MQQRQNESESVGVQSESDVNHKQTESGEGWIYTTIKCLIWRMITKQILEREKDRIKKCRLKMKKSIIETRTYK